MKAFCKYRKSTYCCQVGQICECYFRFLFRSFSMFIFPFYMLCKEMRIDIALSMASLFIFDMLFSRFYRPKLTWNMKSTFTIATIEINDKSLPVAKMVCSRENSSFFILYNLDEWKWVDPQIVLTLFQWDPTTTNKQL